LEALIEAREQGLVRFLGVTGHGKITPSMHMRSLERFDFDSVLLPYNYTLIQNSQYAEGFKKLPDLCIKKNVAIQTTKALARGPLGDKKQDRAVWYDPIEDAKAIEHSVHWVLGNPDVFLNSIGDIHLLPKVLEAADRFQKTPSDEEMQADVEKFGIISPWNE